MAFERLTPYRRTIRPSMPESFPRYVEDELDRLGTVTTNIIEAIKALDARLAALEP